MTAPETAPAERHMGEGLAVTQCCYGHTEHFAGCEDCPYVHGAHRLAATPTALPSSEDALRARAAAYAQEFAEADQNDLTAAFLAFAALQSPRASDVVLGEGCVSLGSWLSAALDDPSVCDAMKADINAWFAAGMPPAATPVPVDASGAGPLAEARERLAVTENCLDCNADDERFWRRVIQFLEEAPWSTNHTTTSAAAAAAAGETA